MSEVQWRRRWKPTLDVKPWRTMAGVKGVKEEQILMLKCLFTDSTYEILVTDLQNVWQEKLEGHAILKRSKKLNPSVEAPLDKLLDHIKSQMDGGDGGNLTFEEQLDRRTLTFTLKSKLAGLPFAWKFNGSLALKNSNITEQLSVPLLSMVEELLRREKELFKTLKAKDTELADLKAQGVKTSRKHLETGPFIEKSFMNSQTHNKDFEAVVKRGGIGAFGEDGQELYHNIMMKSAYLSRDPDEDIDDDMSTSSVDEGALGETWNQKIPPSLISAAVSPTKSPANSPAESPAKSPAKASSSAESTPTKDAEQMRREALQKRLAEDQERKEGLKKKKKKLKL